MSNGNVGFVAVAEDKEFMKKSSLFLSIQNEQESISELAKNIRSELRGLRDSLTGTELDEACAGGASSPNSGSPGILNEMLWGLRSDHEVLKDVRDLVFQIRNNF